MSWLRSCEPAAMRSTLQGHTVSANPSKGTDKPSGLVTLCRIVPKMIGRFESHHRT